ncbi:pseudouridine synthase [Enterococcus hirae 57-03-H11]|uniref:tRNA pseudouridine(38-40) synthase TruA n=1 Tax=Enterococcus TaxID=1350 RepID=UPI000B5401E4|nr:tRNA pseudouridine(38-40) synthase TruA [Enterococcus hirae]OWW63221.1 pseudouridine synthase [Enterococcus hirae 67-03-C5]OWW68643.1 pseudouridine synthase [Enterococcus hirae 57-03-H11]EMF0048287.1 tRNA pseudouridine(38-40) synthase TruA [Enterococcus hirae]EMF0067075.1 tRNA pseudouridine(38-40) synthase TruA [Enterococcus hirae]EMF0107280.1 tRNA pseudouridine(38-40) synthase TruA [Enterococcus hirae]
MTRYKAIIAYDGTHFNGFQKQPNGRTVQEEMEKTLKKMANGKEITVFGSGRTDAGVHAMGQVIHFDYPEERPLERMRFALDTQSPEDIAVKAVEIVSDDFHARYLVKEKTYQFRVDIGKPRSPFRRHYASYFPYPLDLSKIQRALPDLIGTHDFTSFCASGSSIEDKVRTIYEAKMEVNEARDELLFTFRGNGFLYKMIRILVGTLLKIGNGRLSEDSIPEIIAKKDRNAAGPTAHPEGLYLYEVVYDQ